MYFFYFHSVVCWTGRIHHLKNSHTFYKLIVGHFLLTVFEQNSSEFVVSLLRR